MENLLAKEKFSEYKLYFSWGYYCAGYFCYKNLNSPL